MQAEGEAIQIGGNFRDVCTCKRIGDFAACIPFFLHERCSPRDVCSCLAGRKERAHTSGLEAHGRCRRSAHLASGDRAFAFRLDGDHPAGWGARGQSQSARRRAQGPRYTNQDRKPQYHIKPSPPTLTALTALTAAVPPSPSPAPDGSEEERALMHCSPLPCALRPRNSCFSGAGISGEEKESARSLDAAISQVRGARPAAHPSCPPSKR